MIAVEEGYVKGVKLLLDHQEDLELDMKITDVYGKAAREIIYQRDFGEIIGLFSESDV